MDLNRTGRPLPSNLRGRPSCMHNSRTMTPQRWQNSCVRIVDDTRVQVHRLVTQPLTVLIAASRDNGTVCFDACNRASGRIACPLSSHRITHRPCAHNSQVPGPACRRGIWAPRQRPSTGRYGGQGRKISRGKTHLQGKTRRTFLCALRYLNPPPATALATGIIENNRFS